MMRKVIGIVTFVLLMVSCDTNKTNKKQIVNNVKTKVEKQVDTLEIKVEAEQQKIPLKELSEVADTTFVRLADYDDTFVYDMRYATTNNFLKAKVYDCPECYTHAKTARALIKANNSFKKLGYTIKFYDCYRPNSVQYKMWEIVPNPQYVANPKKGSIHNKGGAVDITLVDKDGNELNMGTDFDFFGKKAHHDFTNLPKEVLENRKLLKSVMEKFGFWSIRTEWWHYNLSAGSNDKVANFKWKCN